MHYISAWILILEASQSFKADWMKNNIKQIRNLDHASTLKVHKADQNHMHDAQFEVKGGCWKVN